MIRALNADILVLQEMGAQPYLDELQHDLKSEGLDYPYAALATAADADRHVALLSKRPLKAVTTHADLEWLHDKAHRECFIANSVTTEVHVVPVD